MCAKPHGLCSTSRCDRPGDWVVIRCSRTCGGMVEHLCDHHFSNRMALHRRLACSRCGSAHLLRQKTPGLFWLKFGALQGAPA